MGCDGIHSRVRSQLLPNASENYTIPVNLMGTKLHMLPNEIEPLRKLDAFFLQGTSAQNDTFIYFSGEIDMCIYQDHAEPINSVLDAPSDENAQNYVAQIVVSWSHRKGFLNLDNPLATPSSNTARLSLLKSFTETWAEPFHSLVLNLPDSTELKPLELADWLPPSDAHGTGNVVLVGDALHPMAMCRLIASYLLQVLTNEDQIVETVSIP